MSAYPGGHQEGLQGSGTSCITRSLNFTCIVDDVITATSRVETKVLAKIM
jgi:hypothetical protein